MALGVRRRGRRAGTPRAQDRSQELTDLDWARSVHRALGFVSHGVDAMRNTRTASHSIQPGRGESRRTRTRTSAGGWSTVTEPTKFQRPEFPRWSTVTV